MSASEKGSLGAELDSINSGTLLKLGVISIGLYALFSWVKRHISGEREENE